MTGHELRDARLRLGIKTIAEFARVLNKPYRTVQDWELGNRRIDTMVKPILWLLNKYKGAVTALLNRKT